MTAQYTYQIKGINSDTDTCECCGKTGLKKVVWIVELDQDNNETALPMAYGTTCAAKKLSLNTTGGSKATTERAINDLMIEQKNQARADYLSNDCIIVDTPQGKVAIDKQYRIGQVMQEQGIDRNAAINFIRAQMARKWFMS